LLIKIAVRFLRLSRPFLTSGQLPRGFSTNVSVLVDGTISGGRGRSGLIFVKAKGPFKQQTRQPTTYYTEN